jgi:hypothetical protein
MATKQDQGSFDFGDAEEINRKHQAEISKQMLKDVADKKMTMDEFAEKAKTLSVGKPGKEAAAARTAGISKSTGKGGMGGAGGPPGIKGATSNPNFDKKKGGKIKVKKMAKGGTASSRADGIATKGHTRGKVC